MIEPIADLFEEGDRLVIVPHGPLHGLPFHAFHDGEAYLVDQYLITIVPSAAVFDACRQSTRPFGDRALVVGIDDPWACPGCCARSRWSARPGRRPRSRWVRRRPRRCCAATSAPSTCCTWQRMASSAPTTRRSPRSSSRTPWLTVKDLAELARGAQLVTLSACETGVSGISPGDEVIGLTRGLLSAGCSSAVASLWTVSDESTARLMEHFYARLKTGEGPAEAMQTAMLDIREQYDHPYFWAPFVVVGDGLTRSDASAASADTGVASGAGERTA